VNFRTRAALPFLVAALSALPFLPALSGAFLYWDDRTLLIDSADWRGFSAAHLRWMFTTTYDGPYQPLAWLSYALAFSLWGMSPRAFHASSLGLHASACGLFFLVLQELLAKGAPDASRKERTLAALFGALIWAVHPLRVESVAWISEQRDILCALFSLLTVFLYLRRPGWSLPVLASFGLALLGKSSAIALPFTLLILDVWPLGRFQRQERTVLSEKIPLVLVALAFGVMTVLGHGAAGAVASDSLGLRAAITIHNLGFYLTKIFWPTRLSPYYSVPAGFSLASPSVMISATAVPLVAAAAWGLRRRMPAVWTALAHYVLALTPMLGLMRVGRHLAADRYTLVASMGPAALAGAALLVSRRCAPRAAAVTAALIVAALAARTCNDAASWHDDLSLWTRAVSYDEKSLQARLNLSGALRRAGRPDDAAPHEEAAARLDPTLAGPWNNLAGLALSHKRYGEAERLSRRALLLDPGLAGAHYNLACAFQGLGRSSEAVEQFRIAQGLDPADAKASNNLGLELLRRGRPEKAVLEMRRAVQAAPDWAVARYNLGNALAALGRQAEAARAYDEAIRLDPGLEEAWVNGANALARLGRYEEASRRYERALSMNPGDDAARRNLAAVRRAAGR